jgi:hypothetical protein
VVEGLVGWFGGLVVGGSVVFAPFGALFEGGGLYGHKIHLDPIRSVKVDNRTHSKQ